MKVLQSRSFQRKVKKFTKKQKLLLDEQVKLIVEDPKIGAEKKGDLRGVYVHKFKIKADLYLMAYRIVDENLELITIGSHENYYRNLKKYL
ncbi:MAG: type II toxin-antitoxin system RelE/ParE family toxin [Thermodesulfobacteriota bacterium]|nr:type II toxin-antitoxin system RelE/ParE family toxin [Thermodesulfobacteriota bacterium]